MNKSKRHFKLTDFPLLISFSFPIIVFALFLYGLISMLIFPNERDVLDQNCSLYTGSWELISEDGQRTPVDIPGKIPAEYGEVVTLATKLPDDIPAGECICFRPIWQDVNIYIDGQLRQSYSTKDTRPFGTNSPMRYVFTALNESDAGKELIYQFSSCSKYTGDVRDIYIGDRLSIWIYLLELSGVRTIIALFLLLLSLFCIIVCGVLKLFYQKPLALNHLAWTLFFCAFWMLSEVEFRQIIVKNISILSSYAYWSLIIIPFPLLLYIDEVQSHRYRKVFLFPLFYSSVMLIAGTLLQVFDIVQFVEQVPFIHVGLLMTMACIIATIAIDTLKKRITDYLSVSIGIYGMMLTAVLEMVFYHMGTPFSLGTVLAVGLLFLLIMAIIKTGQDLFQSEKNRQQAIMAREAQAKFLANMSHEIRTPINAIIGMNEMILRENEAEAIQDYALNIQNASNMLLGLVNDVLDFSKIESGQLELVENTYHLPTLLRDEMLLLKARAAETPLATKLEVDPTLPSCFRGDELRIKQVLTNLISNAIKYTKQGSVTLKVFCKQTDSDVAELSFAIIDTGIGIRKEDLAQLFDSFKRLELSKNRNIQGTGLGLNIAKQLVDLMGGNIIVESEYGKGSTFTVTIPQKIMDPQPIGNFDTLTASTHKEHTVSGGLFTAPDAAILIVDDNTMNLSLMKGLMKRTLMKVDFCSGGRECLAVTKHKKYDIIFMDHMMPELDGVETLHLLRADNSNPNHDTTVIALTANAIAGCREQYLSYGFHDYFSKPVQADKLEDLLLKHLPETLVTLNQASANADSVAEEPLQQESFSELFEIDRKAGISYCMDSEEFYQEMLLSFCEQAEEYLPQLAAYYSSQDWKNYAVIAHGIKSNTLTIGATNFSNYSLQHEQAGKEENSSFIHAEYEKYITTLQQLVKMIKSNSIK